MFTASQKDSSTWPYRYSHDRHKHHNIFVVNGVLCKDPGWAQHDPKGTAFDLGNPSVCKNGKVQSRLNVVCWERTAQQCPDWSLQLVNILTFLWGQYL